jgi:uncharacterized membrane protein YedE/YeeE
MKKLFIKVVNFPALVVVGFFAGIFYTKHFYVWDQVSGLPFWKWKHWKQFIKECVNGITFKKKK